MKTLDVDFTYVTNSQLVRLGDNSDEMEVVCYGEPGKGSCRLRVYGEHDLEMEVPRTFALVTQSDEDIAVHEEADALRLNVRGIASQIVHFLGVDPFALQLILHYPSRSEREQFSFIHLDWDGSVFVEAIAHRATRQEVEERIDCKID